jgi:segregation and condensation protein B
MSDRFDHLRLVEALLFASAEPLGPQQIQRHLPEGVELEPLMEELAGLYANRGVNLVRLGNRWAFRTASDLAPQMQIETTATRKPSRAAIETLAIIAYHQPVTRGEIEEIRGVALSRGTLDTLLEAGWIRPRGRRRTPGRPVTWGTTEAFLDQFGLEGLDSLPGLAELKAAGLLDTRPAIAALGARGHLLAEGEAGVDTEDLGDGDGETGEEAEEPLAADFGEDLVATEDEDGAETGGAAGEDAGEEDSPAEPPSEEDEDDDPARREEGYEAETAGAPEDGPLHRKVAIGPNADPV